MRERIQTELARIAAERNIRILYSCESGSRGWGFPSPDSDYDARFIYLLPLDDYLSINERKDNINLPITDELDIAGWELRKFLRLLAKSNATPLEWLQSPIIYGGETGFKEACWPLVQRYFIPRATFHHYLGLSKGSMRGIMEGDRVKIKKYFYILRPLLAALWVLDKREAPPMQFAALRRIIADRPALNAAIDDLLARKEKAVEGEIILLVPEIQAFIEESVSRCEEQGGTLPSQYHDVEPLNRFFREWLGKN